MRLRCEHCCRSFDIPEEKLPRAAKFRFTCPVCKQTNHVDREMGPEPEKEAEDEDFEESDLPSVQVPPGTHLALLMLRDERIAAAVRSYFQARQWEVVEVHEPTAGKAYLRGNRFRGVVLDDSAPGRQVLEEIHRLPGRERREMNCVLIGNQAESFDPLAAFVAGVNSYISSDEAEELETSLQRAQELFDRHLQLWSTTTAG